MPANQEPIDEAELARRQPKRKIGCVAIGLIAFVSFIALVLLGLFFWNMAASKQLNENLAKLKAAGHATNWQELESAYQASTVDDAGPLFVSAGQALANRQDMSLPFIGDGPDPPLPGNTWAQFDAVKAYLAEVETEIETLHREAQFEKPAKYKTDFRDATAAISDTMPYHESHRQACRVLWLDAYVNAHQGNNSEVLKSANTSLRIASSLRNELSLIGHQLSMACVSMSTSILRTFINLEYADAELASLQRTFRSFDAKASLACGLEAEMVAVNEAFHDPLRTGPWPRKQDAAFSIEITQPILDAACTEPWQGVLKVAATAKQTAKEISANPAKAAKYMLSLNMLPAHDATVRAHARAAAQLLIADSLIAAKRFHMKHGRLPTTIDELVPEFLEVVPIDLFSKDSESLRLNTANGKTKIYSLGFNQVDDQGFGESGGALIGPLDIVMELIPNE